VAVAEAGSALGMAAEAIDPERETEAARFLAEASHELRGGAARLALMAEALAETGLAGTDDPPLEPRLRALAAEGRRVQALASTLLDVTRLTTAGRRLEPAAVALGPLVDDILTGQSVPGPDADAGREVRMRVAGDLKVWADPLALDQVLSNLIANAFQHGGPLITIDGWAEDGAVLVRVADDGDGLVPGWGGQVPAPRPGIGGGLGLGIASRLLAMIGGALVYDTGESGGARFTVRLSPA
jgi:signal transduction histidine kinase